MAKKKPATGAVPKAKPAPVVELYEDAAGQWRWRVKAANRKVVADSGEGYRRLRDAEAALAVVKAALKGKAKLIA